MSTLTLHLAGELECFRLGLPWWSDRTSAPFSDEETGVQTGEVVFTDSYFHKTRAWALTLSAASLEVQGTTVVRDTGVRFTVSQYEDENLPSPPMPGRVGCRVGCQ